MEWARHFDKAAGPSFFAGTLHDAWWYTQSAEWLPGRSDEFFTVPPDERLDYILHSPGDERSGLCVQHMTLAYNLMEHGPHFEGLMGVGGTQRLSDHIGVNAELVPNAPLCSPAEAAADPPWDDTIAGMITHPHSAQWYLVGNPGAFSVETSGDVQVRVFAEHDLSRPLAPLPPDVFPSSRYGAPYQVDAGRVYLKVSRPDAGTGDYDLRLHPHMCASQEDACPLTSRDERSLDIEAGKIGWFTLRTDRADAAPGTEASLQTIALMVGSDRPGLEVALLRQSDLGEVVQLGAAGTSDLLSSYTYLSSDGALEDGSFYLVVHNKGAAKAAVTASWSTDLKYLSPLELLCEDDTAGAGKDEMWMNVFVDGQATALRSVDLGEFATDWRKSLVAPLGLIKYVRDVRLELTEIDTSVNDDAVLHFAAQPGDEAGQDDGWDFKPGVYKMKWRLSDGPPASYVPPASP